jgi:flagellar basal body-associated protein FliL
MNEAIMVTLALLLSMVIGGGMGAAFWFSTGSSSRRQRRARELEADLQARWDALYRVQRLNAAFMHARRALREEALRHRNAEQQ